MKTMTSKEKDQVKDQVNSKDMELHLTKVDLKDQLVPTVNYHQVQLPLLKLATNKMNKMTIMRRR